MHNGHFAKFNLIVFLKLIIKDNGYHNCNKFPRITMKLINLLKKLIIDNGYHNYNKFPRITMKLINLLIIKKLRITVVTNLTNFH